MGILEILGLNLGNLNVSVSLGQRSALCNDTVLHRRTPILLPRNEDILGLQESVITARNIVEETIEVPTPELEDILAKLRDLEGQVEDLLGEGGEDAIKVTTTTENAHQGDAGAATEPDSDSTANDESVDDGTEADESDEQAAQSDADSPGPPSSVPGNGIFKEKIQVETEVVTSTMDDTTSTITMTRTMTTTVTIPPEPAEGTAEPTPEASPNNESDSEPTVAAPKANVRLGAAFKEAGQPFSASNATAVALNAEKPSKVPGNLVSAPQTSLPVPAVKQFHQALYTNSSMSSGFQTVTLPGAQ